MNTLAPGLHFAYWPWQYRIIKVPVTVVPQGEIALVLAAAGQAIPSERILGQVVDCDNFQDARKFLVNGGEKGRQLGILTAGTYRINTAQFTLITSVTSHEHGMMAEPLALLRIQSDMVGIVTTLDGHPIEAGIVLNWANRTEAHHFDEKLSSITVRSKDGFAFNLDVSRIIHVGALDAPKVISRVGSMQNLVDHVLQPIVGNYFRNSAQDYTVLDFLSARSHRQL